MKDFLNKNKSFLIIGFITLVIFAGGILLFTKSSSTSQTTKIINASLLVPQNALETSGFSNGVYLPATSGATLTLVEFGDYECPACGIYSPFVKQLLTDFAGKVNYVFRNYPLQQHKNAFISSYAVEAAGLQGKYWEMHEKMYATQAEWSKLAEPTSVFVEYAQGFGLNVTQFTNDLSSSIVKNKIQNDTNDGNTIGLTSTPTLYLNGKELPFVDSYDQLKKLIQSALSP